MISLVTVTQGNPKALRRTIDNVRDAFGGMLNEFVVGDVSVFDGDFREGFSDVRFVPLPFNALFKRGFASVLNEVASHATNDLCLYLNVSEIVEKNLNTSLIKPDFNCYSFNHATDPNVWTRLWNRKELQWSGRIHEEIVGPRRKCPQILFCMADTPKDEEDELRAGIYNDIKEMVYFQQYIHLVEHPEDLAGTNEGWLRYSRDQYDDLKRRIAAKGDRALALENRDKELYLRSAEKDQPAKEWSKP